MKNTLTTFFIFFINVLSMAQEPTISPEFFAADDEITITYEVTGTALQNLDDAWIWMWIPGEGIDAPSNINPANSNSSATNPAKFTRTTGNSGEVFFSITLTPTEFLDTPKENIEQIGMLLKGNDWSDGQTSDYVASISDGFTLVMDSPTGNYGFYESSQEINISVRTSESASIDILVDDVSIQSGSNTTSLSINHSIIDDGAVHIITARADNGSEVKTTSHSYTITPTSTNENIPAGLRDGINYNPNNTSATLVLRAPNKEHVFVIGDFNNWSLDNNYLMKKDGELFWLEIDNLISGQEYLFQYLVDGDIKIADPYAEKISSQFDDAEIITDGRYPNLTPYPNNQTTEAVAYLQTNRASFEWSEFTRPANEDLIIYELLIRDFTEERTYDAVTARLDYLADLGVNAIELMPVQEFEGNLSWGYNPAFMFAVDKYYGTELDFKTLVDEAHKRGMAVILDIVLNHHFGRNSLVRLYNEDLYGRPTSDNPWFNVTAKHDFNVGYDFNHESQYTKDYVDRVVTYWLEEYNIDGYRFDLSKGFTQRNSTGNLSLWANYDATRVEIWKRIADVIWAQDPTAYVILEHFADNSEEKELANYGMMLWGNRNGKFIGLGRGSSASLSDVYHASIGWNDPHLIAYMESHDEERFMWELTKSGSISTQAALERAKINTAFFLSIPGPKMIWQFGEFGYDEELNNDRLGIKPTRWEYLEDPEREKLFNVYKSLINLRTRTNYINEDYFSWSSGNYIKTINIAHPDVDIYLVGNFDDDEQNGTHSFTKTGTWYNYFTGQSIEVKELNKEVTLGGGEFYIYTSERIENYIEDQRLTLSATDNPHKDIYMYPNPSSEFIQIEGHGENWSYRITDISGKTALNGVSKSSNLTLNISTLNNGVYTLTINTRNTSVSRKFVKK